MAERTGASSAWLVPEMVSRFNAKGAQVMSEAYEKNDGIGRMEREMMQMQIWNKNREFPASTKVLEFDSKVNMEGLLCFMYYANIDLKVVIILDDAHCGDVQFVPMLRFKDGLNPPDRETAKSWVSDNRRCKFEVVDAETCTNEVHFLLSPSAQFVLFVLGKYTLFLACFQ
jgi:hypothetical protein